MSAGRRLAPPGSGTRVLVVGLGVSGAAAAQALLRRGAAVTVVDAAGGAALEERASTLRLAGAQVRLGRAAAADVAGADLVVASPGVPQGGDVLDEARRRRLPLWSEPELAWRLAAGRTRLLAVSGTNGKTTTTELLAGCLDAPAAGNIGTPLVELLAADVPPPLVVAELSSFQLAFTAALRADVAVLLNVAADHLDWHGSLDAYRAAKARVWANQRRGDWAVLNADDEGARAAATAHPPAGRAAGFTLAAPQRGQVGVDAGAVVAFLGEAPVEVVAVEALGVTGAHNVANACAAVAAALAAGANASDLAGQLAAYRPGRHRLERVALVDGVSYVDDSKATNPHAAAAALASFPRGSVVWIAGGLAKGLTFETLRGEISRRVRSAATIGTSGPEIARLVRDLGIDVVEAGTLPQAVAAAAAAARPGDTVLLAPACASMDQFRDYAERGRVFRDAVAALAAGDRPQPVVVKEAAGGH